MVPLLQVQLVQAFAFQESPFSSTSPSLVMQYSCSLLLTGSSGLSSVDAQRYEDVFDASFVNRWTAWSEL